MTVFLIMARYHTTVLTHFSYKERQHTQGSGGRVSIEGTCNQQQIEVRPPLRI